MSPVCLYVCESIYTWVKHGDGVQGKGGIASHEGLWRGIVGCGAVPSLQSVRLAPHLPCPSVHLPIAHKPTPSSTTALTIDYTVLAPWLALWNHNTPPCIQKSCIGRQTTTTDYKLKILSKWLKSGKNLPRYCPKYTCCKHQLKLWSYFTFARLRGYQA